MASRWLCQPRACSSDVSLVMFARLIHGFISKEDARSKLQNAPLGTFLLRFSETNIVDVDAKDPSINGHGYLTLAVNEQDPSNGWLIADLSLSAC